MIKNNNKKRVVLIIAAALSVALIFAVGFLFGSQYLSIQNGTIAIKKSEIGKPSNLDFSVFWDVWNKVIDNYPGKVDQQKMLEGATKGILVGLGDPYSEFLTSAENKQLLDDLEGNFSGVGIEISMKNGALTVVSTLDSTPAQQAGIKANDIILKIDDNLTEKITLSEAVSKIRGKNGSKVKLSILQKANGETKAFTLIRATIHVKSVKWEIKNDNIGYIQITQFGSDTEELMKQASNEVLAKNPKGIILDLRNNPGGYLDTSIDVSSYFIKKGIIVTEESKNGEKKNYKSNGNGSLAGIKLVVLINSGSASASEITAGAIQDYKVGTLVGEKTFGKGSVQVVEDLKGNNALRLTVAKWLTPNGRYINSTGISADIEIKLTQEDENNKKDPQLEKALEILK